MKSINDVVHQGRRLFDEAVKKGDYKRAKNIERITNKYIIHTSSYLYKQKHSKKYLGIPPRFFNDAQLGQLKVNTRTRQGLNAG